MKNENKEIIQITAKEILLSIFDFSMPFFESNQIYRVSAKKYKQIREIEKTDFSERIKYLKRQGMINQFIEGKEKYFEITPKGLEKISKYNSEIIKIERPQKWDSKWRVVIFDIPEKHKQARSAFRLKLDKLGFQMIQKSVYVYPFECTQEIMQLSETLSESKNILIMISEIIQTEYNLINIFLEKNILSKADLT